MAGDPVVGASVTSANGNTQTNTSLTVATPAADPALSTLLVIEISGDSTGTGVAPSGMASSGWTKVGEVVDTNSGTATSSSYIGVFQKVIPAGTAAGSSPFTWTNAGQMASICTAYTNFDQANPVVWIAGMDKQTTDTVYTVSGTTSVAGLVCSVFANRSAGTAWSNLPDNARTQSNVSTSGCTVIGRVTSVAVAAGTALTKTANAASTSVGTSAIYSVKSAAPSATPVSTSRSTTWSVAGSATTVSTARSSTWNVRTYVSEFTSALPMYVAHRGGDNDWVEMTLDAYTHAVGNGAKALNVDAVRCSSGEFVASHDTTTGRVFGTNYTIGSTPWSTLQSLRTTTGNFPIALVSDLLDAFPGAVWFIENKGNASDDSALLDLIDAHGGGAARTVIKGYYTASTPATDAHARGYTTWGYYYAADLANLPSTASRWDLLGLDYTDTSSSDWSTIKSYGKPVLGHVIPSAAGASQAFSEGADGVMTGKVLGVVPGAATPVSASRSTTWNDQALVSTARSSSWATDAVVTSTRSTTWQVTSAVSTSRASNWSTESTVSAGRSSSWAIEALVSQSRPSTWTVRTSVSASRSSSWAIEASVGTSRSTSWDVGGTLTTVTTARSSSWAVDALVSSVRSTSWTVAGTVSASRPSTWSTEVLVSTSRSSSWAAGVEVDQSRSTVWDTLGAASAARSTTWNTESDNPAPGNDLSLDVHVLPDRFSVTVLTTEHLTATVGEQ